MTVLNDALAAALRGPPRPPDPGPRPPPPQTVDEAAHYFGGGRRANRALADELGVDIRTVQRWRAYETGGAGERRRPRASSLKRVRTAVGRTSRRRDELTTWRARRTLFTSWRPHHRVGRARRAGIDVRIGADIRVSAACRPHTMPADVGGVHRHTFIDGELLGPVLDAFEAGVDVGTDELYDDVDDRSLLGAFMLRFWFPHDDRHPAWLCGSGVRWAQVHTR